MNKSLLISVLLLICSCELRAQDMGIMFDTVYYDYQFLKVPKKHANFFRLPAEMKDSNHYEVTYYDMYGYPKFTAIYKPVYRDYHYSIEEGVGIKDGLFYQYDSGHVVMSCNVKNNEIVESWTSYFKNGKPHMVKKGDYLSKGYYFTEYDSLGKKLAEGSSKLSFRVKTESGWINTPYRPRIAKEGPWYYYYIDTQMLYKVLCFQDGYRHGPCAYYDGKTRKKITKGQYFEGNRVGEWIWYDNENGNKIKEQNYTDNYLEGKAFEYDKNTNKLLVTGQYKWGYRVGDWTVFYPGTDIILMKIKYRKNKGYAYVYDSSNNFKIIKEGPMYDDRLTGTWKEYYKNSNKVLFTLAFDNSNLDGYIKQFDTLGNIESQCEFRNNIPKGKWKYFYPYSEKLWAEKQIIDSNQSRIITYYRNGKMKRNGLIKLNKIIEQNCFDETGLPETCKDIYTPAKFSEDVNSYIGKNLKYPEVARDLKIQGTVEVGFIVNEVGKIENIRVTKGVDKLIDEEAIRIITSMQLWKPAMIEETPIKTYEQLKVLFWLNEKEIDEGK